MKWCPNCGQELKKDGFCSNCGSSSVMPGIRYNTEKESQVIKQTQKETVSDNKKQNKKQIKEKKYCRSCGKKLNKKGICKECSSSTFMPGISEKEKYKFCSNCGQELNEEGICTNCGIKNNLDESEISSKTGIANLLGFFSIIAFFAPLILRLNSVNISFLLSFIAIILGKIIDIKNGFTTIVLIIEIIFTIVFIFPAYFFFSSCIGIHL